MLTKLIVGIYSALLELGLWLILFVGLIAGWKANGFSGAIVGGMGASVFGAIFFGAFLILNDIRVRLKAIESSSQELLVPRASARAARINSAEVSISSAWNKPGAFASTAAAVIALGVLVFQLGAGDYESEEVAEVEKQPEPTAEAVSRKRPSLYEQWEVSGSSATNSSANAQQRSASSAPAPDPEIVTMRNPLDSIAKKHTPPLTLESGKRIKFPEEFKIFEAMGQGEIEDGASVKTPEGWKQIELWGDAPSEEITLPDSAGQCATQVTWRSALIDGVHIEVKQSGEVEWRDYVKEINSGNLALMWNVRALRVTRKASPVATDVGYLRWCKEPNPVGQEEPKQKQTSDKLKVRAEPAVQIVADNPSGYSQEFVKPANCMVQIRSVLSPDERSWNAQYEVEMFESGPDVWVRYDERIKSGNSRFIWDEVKLRTKTIKGVPSLEYSFYCRDSGTEAYLHTIPGAPEQGPVKPGTNTETPITLSDIEKCYVRLQYESKDPKAVEIDVFSKMASGKTLYSPYEVFRLPENLHDFYFHFKSGEISEPRFALECVQ